MMKKFIIGFLIFLFLLIILLSIQYYIQESERKAYWKNLRGINNDKKILFDKNDVMFLDYDWKVYTESSNKEGYDKWYVPVNSNINKPEQTDIFIKLSNESYPPF